MKEILETELISALRHEIRTEMDTAYQDTEVKL